MVVRLLNRVGVSVNRTGDADSCGHTRAGGSSNVNIWVNRYKYNHNGEVTKCQDMTLHKLMKAQEVLGFLRTLI